MKLLTIGDPNLNEVCKKYNCKLDEIYIIADMPKRMIYKKLNLKNVYYINNVEDLEEYKKVLKEIGMKFDKVIMNPPYEKNLHLKVVEEVMKHLDKDGEVVNLSPIRWLQDPVADKKKNSDYNKYENSISKHIKTLNIVKAEEATKLFGANFTMDIGMYILNNNEYLVYKKLFNNSIINKVENKLDTSMSDVVENNKLNGWRVRVSEMRPVPSFAIESNVAKGFLFETTHYINSWVYHNGYSLDKKFWTENVISKGSRATYKLGDNLPLSIKFKTKNEAINFENSTKTSFHRYLVLKLKTDMHFPFRYLPFMQDYTQPWTNERFYKYFNITEEEQRIIEETMAQYETN